MDSLSSLNEFQRITVPRSCSLTPTLAGIGAIVPTETQALGIYTQEVVDQANRLLLKQVLSYLVRQTFVKSWKARFKLRILGVL